MVQNDNVFNASDVNINYSIDKKNVFFKDKKSVNCFYKDVLSNVTENPLAASQRECFATNYMMKNKDFKLDYISESDLNKNRRYPQKNENKVKIYYFTKLN